MIDISKVKIMLAPMEGVIDSIMRDILTRIGGVDLCVTEFIRVTDQPIPDHVLYKYAPELLNGSRTPCGTPLLVQFLGSNCDMLALNSRRAIDLGAAGIDLNFGCPAKTVNRHDGGASLLKDPHRIFEIVSAVRGAVPKSHGVSAKIRLGFHDKSRFLEIAHAAEDAGASFLTVHARTRDESYSPPAHWEYIARIREELKIPVIANGDIWNLEDFKNCERVSGCKTFMLGRGLVANPALALQIQTQGRVLFWQEVLGYYREFIDLSEQQKSSTYAVARAKQWCKQFGRNYPEAVELFQQVKLCEDVGTLRTILGSSPAIVSN